MKVYEKMGMDTEAALKWIYQCKGRPCLDCEAYPNKTSGELSSRCAARYLLSDVHEPPKVPRTNGDRIRAMTDEELAKYLDGLGFGGTPPTCDMDGERDYKKCRDCWLDWLKQEVDNG